MTYTVGQLIQVSDYNSFRTAVNQIYGVGNGEIGYGQTAITLAAPVSTSDLVKSNQWTPLRNAIAVCATHQNTSATGLPIASDLEVGDLIRAYPNVPTIITNITNNRHNVGAGQLTNYPNQASTAYSTNWASNINFAFEAQWTTADKCRYFWNSGGSLAITLSFVPTGVYPRGVAWSSFINQLGGIVVRWNKTEPALSYPGTQVQPNVGYYGLPMSDLLLWQGFNTQGSYAFPTNNITVHGRSVDGPLGANADNGKQQRFTVNINDVATTGSDLVIGSWNAAISFQKATTSLTQESPTVTITTAFTGS